MLECITAPFLDVEDRPGFVPLDGSILSFSLLPGAFWSTSHMVPFPQGTSLSCGDVGFEISTLEKLLHPQAAIFRESICSSKAYFFPPPHCSQSSLYAPSLPHSAGAPLLVRLWKE